MAESKKPDPGWWTKQGYALASGPVGMWGNTLLKAREWALAHPTASRVLGAPPEMFPTPDELGNFRRNQSAALDDNGLGLEDVTQFGAGLAADPLTYVPMGKAKGLVGVLKRGLQGAAMGGADEFVRSGGDTDAALQAAKTGGMVGAGTNVVGQLGGKALRKILPDTSEVLSRQSVADKAGLTPTAGDLLPEGSGLRTFEEVGEQIPFSGMKAKRAAQAKALRETAERVRGGLDRNAKGGSVAQMLENRKAYLKGEATRLYDKVDDLTTQYSDPTAWNKATGAAQKVPEVDLTPVRSTAKKLMAEASDAISPDSEIVNKLKPYAQARNRDFSAVRTSMTNLNGDIAAAKAKGDDNLVRALTQVKESMKEANNAWGEGQTGDIKKAYDEATKFYAESYAPWKDRLGKKLVDANEGMTSERAAKTLFTNLRDYKDSVKLWDTLDQPTKDAVIVEMVDGAFQQANKGDKFNPGTLARELRKLVEKSGKENPMFKQDGDVLLGLAKTIEMFPRASQYWVNPPTGNRMQRWMLPLAGGAYSASQFDPTGISGSLIGGAAALTGAGALTSRILDSEANRKTLRMIAKANAADPLVKQMAARLMNQAAGVAPRLGPMNRERIQQ